MSSINRSEFTSRMFRYVRVISTKFYVDGETFEVIYSRTNSPSYPFVGSSIYVFCDKMLVPDSIMMMWENKDRILSKILVEKEALYTTEINAQLAFDSSGLSMILNAYKDGSFDSKTLMPFEFMHEVILDPLEYFQISYLSKDIVTREKIVLRFFPVKEEEIMLERLLMEGVRILDDGKDLMMDRFHSRIMDMEQLNEMISEYYNSRYFTTRKKKMEEGSMSISDMSATMSMWQDTPLTLKRLRYWERTRHNLFGTVFCFHMGLDIPLVFDMDMSSMFSYSGPSYFLTPDFVFEYNSVLYLVDFSVTQANSGVVADKKRAKYEDLRNGLSMFLSREVRFEPLVWKINSDSEYTLPEEFDFMRVLFDSDEVLSMIKETNEKLMLIPNYDIVKKDMRDDFDEDDDIEMDVNAEMLADLLKKILQHASIEGKLTDPVENSRKDMNFRDSVKMKFKDTEYYDYLVKSKDLDEESYLAEMKSMFTKMIAQGKHPKYLDDVINYNPSEIFKTTAEEFMKTTKLRSEYLRNPEWKLPKMFKLPLMDLTVENALEDFGSTIPSYYDSIFDLPDGTTFLRNKPMSDQDLIHEKEEKNKEYRDYPVMGIGTDPAQDRMVIEDLIEFFLDTTDKDFNFDGMDEAFSKYSFYKEMMNTNVWMTLNFWSDLVMNISYLEGRRHLKNSKKGHTIAKNFGKYILFLSEGSKLTAQKQIRFKILTSKRSVFNKNYNFLHKYYDHEVFEDMVETRWLTISVTDIKHFVKIREVSLALVSDMNDKNAEVIRNKEMSIKVMDKSMMTILLILMENKRGTSTSSQLNRYIMHSMTGYVSNRKKLIQDISSTPCRSILESYVRICQYSWMVEMADRSEKLWYDRITSMASTDTEYDRLRLPSFYDTSKIVEFSTIMNEIYVGNLFDKDSGFLDHRLKAVVAKMTEAEIHFLKNKDRPESKGMVEDVEGFLMMKDELHFFDDKFVVSATKRFFKKKASKIMMKEAQMRAYTSVVDDAMMMTSSLIGGPYDSEVLEFSNRVKKSKSFLTLHQEVEKLSTNILLHMVSQEEVIEALFAVFPKSQIGGPREILIQSVKLRMSVKFLEVMSRMICHRHEKEMLTKDRSKAEIQSDKMNTYKSELKRLRVKGVPSLITSFNADATRWAPGFVMEHNMQSVMNWEIEDQMKDFLLTTLSSFSSKKIMVPTELMVKWKSKPMEEIEFLDSIQHFREKALDNEGVVEMRSGMGQGMLHFMSSIYHCIVDDMADEIMETVLRKVYSTNLIQSSLISSDDKTKIALFKFSDANKASDSLKAYVMLGDMIYRLANIHTNWKKSALHFTIAEFNSLFSVGKRMSLATIKDLYTACSTPDLSCPEEAVKFVLSNMRRCLEHGVYLTTIEVMMKSMRLFLMKAYRYDKSVVDNLCMTLNCVEAELPYQLGFIPLEYPVETLIYGPDIHMFVNENNTSLSTFYKNLHGATPVERQSLGKGAVPFSDVMKGKFWMELPMRLDKRLKAIKDQFFEEELVLSPVQVLEKMDKSALDVNLSQTDMAHHREYVLEYFVGMSRNFEFQETMVVHSLVRALSMSRGKALPYPRLSKAVEAETEMRKLISRMKNLGFATELDKETMEELEEVLVMEETDCLGFVNLIMDQKSDISSINILTGLRDVVTNAKKIQEDLKAMVRKSKYLHPTMRNLRFYMSDIGTMVDPKDMLSYLFSPERDFTNTTAQTFFSMVNMTGIIPDMEAIHKNPFHFVKIFMQGGDYPFKRFKEFLSYYKKSLKFVKVVMLSDFPCGGNMMDNITNLYRSRSSPYYVLEDPSRNRKESGELAFLSRVSMDKMKMPPSRAESFTDISMSDTKLNMLEKLSKVTQGNWVDSYFLNMTRVNYRTFKRKKGKVVYKYWTDGKAMITAEENTMMKQKIVNVSVVFSEDPEKEFSSELLMSIFHRYMFEMTSTGYSLWFIRKDFRSEELKVSYAVMPLYFRVRFDYGAVTWKAHMEFKVQDYEDDSVYDFCSTLIYEDPYTIRMSDLEEMTFMTEDFEELAVRDMLSETTDILTLDRMFKSLKWTMEDFLPDSKRDFSDKKITMEEGRRQVAEINKNFGLQNMKDTLMAVIGSNVLTAERPNLGGREDTDEVVFMSAFLSGKDNESGAEVVDFNILDTIYSSLQGKAQKDRKEEEYSMESDRISIIKIMDRMVTESVREYLILNRDTIKNNVRMVRKKPELGDNFHNSLICNIIGLFEDEGGISDYMAVMIYNVILKNMASTLNIQASTGLARLKDQDGKIKMPKFRMVERTDTLLELEDDLEANF